MGDGAVFPFHHTFFCCPRLGFLSLGTIGILGWIILRCGAGLYILECLPAALASTPYMLVAPPTPVMTAETVSRNCQMSLWVGGVKMSLAEKH